MSRGSICVIGAGQLGSRHLQSLVSLGEAYQYHAVDPSAKSCELARQGMGPIGEKLHVHSSIQDLPCELDVVVVATGAAVRKKVVTELLAHTKVRYLILEKILFQSVADCLWARDFLKDYPAKVWVNFARRLQPAYQAIQASLTPQQTMAIHVSGSRWGLATSALHFLDLFLFLAGHDSLTIDKFAGEIYPSRHLDCFECTGALSGQLGAGQTYSLSSWADSNAPMRVTIDTPECRWIVDEKGNQVYANKTSVASEWMPETLTYPLLFQSQLTGPVVETILKTGTCGLSDYETALQSHIPFLKAWNGLFAPDADPNTTLCKVT